MKTFFKCLEKAWWLKKKINESLINNVKKLGTGLRYKTKKKKKERVCFNLSLLSFLYWLSRKDMEKNSVTTF